MPLSYEENWFCLSGLSRAAGCANYKYAERQHKITRLKTGSGDLSPATKDRVEYYRHLDYYVRRNGEWHLGRVAVWDGAAPEWHLLPKAISFHVENDREERGIFAFARVDEPGFPFPDHPLVPLFLSGRRAT